MTPEQSEEIAADCITVLAGLAKDDDDTSWVNVMSGRRMRSATKQLTFRGPQRDRVLVFLDKPARRAEIFLHPETTLTIATLLRDFGFEAQAIRIESAFQAMVESLRGH